MTILAITGDPRIGKSTVVTHVAEELKKRSLKVGGIISKEVRNNNTRTGFEFIDLTTNERMTLASTVGNGPRLGRYVVNLEGCNFASKRLISAIENSDVIICDELGPMEFKSKEFIACTKDLLETDKTVIIVVHKRLQHPIIDQFKKRASFIINVDLQNRDRAHHLLLDRL